MLEGKPLNNFVTLQGKIRIIVDNKIESTHQGDLIEWRHKNNLRVKIKAENNNLSSQKHIPEKKIMLSLKARDEGVTKKNEPFLHLFYYQNNNLTDKEIKEHILKIRHDVINQD